MDATVALGPRRLPPDDLPARDGGPPDGVQGPHGLLECVVQELVGREALLVGYLSGLLLRFFLVIRTIGAKGDS